eukprot:NODE_4_length_77007_cov_1.156642.p70 type:complete len:115 gc:universal NODE_4_length_77007_cov_1.156642:60028-60372(+)
MSSRLKEYLEQSSFSMYSSFGQADYSSLFEPRKGQKLTGDNFTPLDDSAKDFGNKSKNHKAIPKKPSVMEAQPKNELFRVRKISSNEQESTPDEFDTQNQNDDMQISNSESPQQ